MPGDESNPYAAPSSELGSSGEPPPTTDASDVASVRRVYIGREAVIRGMGTAGYAVAVCWASAAVMNLAALGLGGHPKPDDLIWVGLCLAMAAGNYGLGRGLRRLRAWARWTSIALSFLGILLVLAVFWFLEFAYFRSVGPVLALYGVLFGSTAGLLLTRKVATVFSPDYAATIAMTPRLRPRAINEWGAAVGLVLTHFVLGAALYIFLVG